ncbi:hypothetical protein [Pantoea sp. Mhis]|uniref:hypothetical protein n=1 Tax=Pantoea sp. Mhis TaxID=2576759 RepID=UPI00351B0099
MLVFMCSLHLVLLIFLSKSFNNQLIQVKLMHKEIEEMFQLVHKHPVSSFNVN